MTQLDSVKNHEKVDVKVDDSKIKLVLGCVNFQQLSAIWSLETDLFLEVEDEVLVYVLGKNFVILQEFFLRSGKVKIALLLSIFSYIFSQHWAHERAFGHPTGVCLCL